MSSILKVILRNIIQGPSTSITPLKIHLHRKNSRGKIKHDPEACVACHMCEYVCEAVP